MLSENVSKIIDSSKHKRDETVSKHGTNRNGKSTLEWI